MELAVPVMLTEATASPAVPPLAFCESAAPPPYAPAVAPNIARDWPEVRLIVDVPLPPKPAVPPLVPPASPPTAFCSSVSQPVVEPLTTLLRLTDAPLPP